MKFASVDALSELVWSPRNGLSLRCADFSFTGKKAKLLSPSVFDDIAQTNNNKMESHSKSNSIQHQEEEADEVNQACSEKNRPLSGIGDSVEDTKPGREEMETNDDVEEAQTRVGTSRRSLDSPRGETEALLANEELERDGTEEEPSNRVEATDENDLPSPASKAVVVACERLAKAKGKEKALSDGNFNDDESFGSVESCNSAGLVSRGRKKRAGFEEQGLILGSKRLKTLSQECLESTSKLKHDSSFMNWISNMTKGIWKGNEEDNSPLVPLTTTTSDANGQVNAIVDQPEMSGCRNTGFQSFFQSIYCQKKSDQDAVEVGNANVASLQELPERCLITRGDHVSSSGNGVAPVSEPDISSGKVGINQTSETFSSEKKQDDKETNISLLPLSKSKQSEKQKTCCEGDEKDVQCLTKKKVLQRDKAQRNIQ